MNSIWHKRRVLITGISGFIGSRLALSLSNLGACIVGLSRTWTAFPENYKVYRGDITDFNLLRSIISFHEIDTIFHLAANAIVRVSAKDPMSTYNCNVMGTCAVLEAARAVGGVKSIVVASSDKAYGDHDVLPYTESHPLQPKNTYDTSKACMDLMAQSYRYNYDMPIVVTRCSNVYGPGDNNTSRIVPNTILRALENKPPLLYSDVEKMKREFIYIDDVINAYMLLGLEQSINNLNFPAINIGGTGAMKIYDLVTIICQETGLFEQPIIEQRDPKFKEISEQWIDASYLNSLGWKPDTTITSGIHKTVKWYKGLR